MLLIYLTLIDSEEDQKKFELLYNLYKKRMWFTANAILHDPLDAEDAVQDAFIAIARNMDCLGDVREISTISYLLKTARNMALNHRARSRSDELVGDDCFDGLVAVDEEQLERLCQQEDAEKILSAIKSLPQIYCDVMSYRYLNGLSVDEIAQVTQRKAVTVKKQLARGKMLLKAALEEESKYARK